MGWTYLSPSKHHLELKLLAVEVKSSRTRKKIDDNHDSEPIVKPGIEEATKAIGIFEEFSLFARFGEDMMKYIKDINRGVDKEERCCKKQDIITNYFKKEM